MFKGNSQKGSNEEKSVRMEIRTMLNRFEVWQSIWEREPLTDKSLLKMNLLTKAI